MTLMYGPCLGCGKENTLHLLCTECYHLAPVGMRLKLLYLIGKGNTKGLQWSRVTTEIRVWIKAKRAKS